MTVPRIALALLLTGCTAEPRVLEWRGLKNPELKIADFNEDHPTQDAATFSAHGKDLNIKITQRTAKAEDAETLWKGIRIQTEGVFNEYPAPYPGYVSRKVGCDEKFKPKRVAREDSPVLWKEALLLFSNDRFAFGACTPESLSKRALAGAVFCKKAAMSYEIKIFQNFYNQDFSELQKIFRGFDCAKR